MYLLGCAIARDPFREDDAVDGLGALIIDGDCLGPANEFVYYCENRIGINAEGNQSLIAENVNVQRLKWLVGGQATVGGPGVWISGFIEITKCTIAYVSGDDATYARPAEPLCDVGQSALEPLMGRQL